MFTDLVLAVTSEGGIAVYAVSANLTVQCNSLQFSGNLRNFWMGPRKQFR